MAETEKARIFRELDKERAALAQLDDEQLISEIGDRVYRSCLIFETLEGMGRVNGNGHHMASNIAEQARQLMIERLRKDWKPTE